MSLKLNIKLDWKMLRKQKLTLLNLIAKGTKEAIDLEGIIGLIDDIQDQASEIIGEADVFGTIAVTNANFVDNKWNVTIAYDKGGIVISEINCIVQEDEDVIVEKPNSVDYWDDDMEYQVSEVAEKVKYWNKENFKI